MATLVNATIPPLSLLPRRNVPTKDVSETPRSSRGTMLVASESSIARKGDSVVSRLDVPSLPAVPSPDMEEKSGTTPNRLQTVDGQRSKPVGGSGQQRGRQQCRKPAKRRSAEGKEETLVRKELHLKHGSGGWGGGDNGFTALRKPSTTD